MIIKTKTGAVWNEHKKRKHLFFFPRLYLLLALLLQTQKRLVSVLPNDDLYLSRIYEFIFTIAMHSRLYCVSFNGNINTCLHNKYT